MWGGEGIIFMEYHPQYARNAQYFYYHLLSVCMVLLYTIHLLTYHYVHIIFIIEKEAENSEGGFGARIYLN